MHSVVRKPFTGRMSAHKAAAPPPECHADDASVPAHPGFAVVIVPVADHLEASLRWLDLVFTAVYPLLGGRAL
jgi:hypothetical protein